MVFLRCPFFLGSPLWLDCKDLAEVKTWMSQNQVLPVDTILFYNNGKKIQDPSAVLVRESTVEAVLGLPGGKGGFGSMLRMIGAQIEKTTNKEACRDLSGRRLRDINEETRLRNFVSKKAEREQIEAEKKAAKMEKLRKFVTEGESKHEFHDQKYDNEREAATERVHEAIDQARASTSGAKRKAQDKEPSQGSSSGKPKAFWVGVDLTESDLDSSSDDEEDEVPAKKSKSQN